MEFLPKSMGTRPRLACEVRAEGVVAARAEDSLAVLSAVSRVPLEGGAMVPHLRVSDTGVAAASVAVAANGFGEAGRAVLVAAVRKALEAVCLRSREVTLVVPDAAVRVLLLDFDALPAKPAEALPVVRFRLKKLLPFDADEAAVSYQVMASTKDLLHVLAVAMPREVLAECESVVREAGFEPGAVLPSTLAALAGLIDGDRPTLVVNAGQEGVTTAIVKGGVLLLHRTVDLGADLQADLAAGMPGPEAAAKETGAEPTNEVAQAVSVAAAYFEDTLETAPSVILAAGTLGADALTVLLDEAYVGPLAVQEMMDRQMLGAGADSAGTPAGVPLGWLAGVRGALAN
jgi:type IV pilus assembly protein PilM